jgi:class 3 adenylate cyclase
VHTGAVATALPAPRTRRHWGLRLAASCGAVLFAVALSGILFQIVSLEYRVDPVTGWFVWVSGTASVFFGTLIFLDRDQRVNGLLLMAVGVLNQLPTSNLLLSFMPVWAIFLMELNNFLPVLVLTLVLLRFPERRLQKRYERIFMAVMATWLLSFQAIHAVTWPCWATPRTVVQWPLWLVNCGLSEISLIVANWGLLVFYTGAILLLVLRILRTRGLDRRIYVPVHIASIAGGVVAIQLGVLSLIDSYGVEVPMSLQLNPGPTGQFEFLRNLYLALAVIPLMLFLAHLGRRLLQLRIAGMIAEINVARTPDGIQKALRRALGDPSLLIYAWSHEHQQYVDIDGRFFSENTLPHRVTLDVSNPDGTARARIVADESVAHHPDLLRAACDAGGLALQNSALQASLLLTTERERSSRELSETLSHFLPTGLADRLRRDGLRIGQPELVEITVLMSDIRGYSGIAETIGPTQLAAQLNEHRSAMNHVITNCAGIVMQYMGDAIFAVFGPTPSPGKHADQAFTASQEMHRQQDQINETWTSLGQPTFGMGIGLSTGQVAAALLGSDERFEYTLVGDAVNLAQRLQDLARPAGTTVISETTWDNLTEPPAEYEQRELQLVKGRQTPITCYRVTMPAHAASDVIDRTSTADM